jgi:hypothetical protein
MNETIFRILAAVILVTGMAISSYYRIKADKESGEKLSRKADGNALMTIIRIGGLILWLSPFVYLINPTWMVWSKLGLPEAVRWLGVGARRSLCGWDLLAVQQYRKRHHARQRDAQGTQTRHERHLPLGTASACTRSGHPCSFLRDDGG